MSLSVLRWLGFALLLGAGCHAKPARPFEVELEGHLRGESGDGHRVVLVATEPCDPDAIGSTRTVAMALLGPAAKDGAFGAEASAHEGTRFYLCAFALDSTDYAIAFGQYERNPIVVAARGEARGRARTSRRRAVVDRAAPLAEGPLPRAVAYGELARGHVPGAISTPLGS